jgi:hypothetical protein
MNLQSLPKLTKTTDYERRFFRNQGEMTMISPMYLLHKNRCCFVLFLAKAFF